MSDYIDVNLAVINVRIKRDLEALDRSAPGVYSVFVLKGISPSSMAAAALDVFHAICPISVFDDFEFCVFDPRTGRVFNEKENHESGSSAHLGRDLQRISDRMPRLYSVEVLAGGDDDSETSLGTVQIIAPNKQTAKNKAFDLLWDPRLDSASCSPRYNLSILSTQGGRL